jgi:hypothetical protein
VHAEMALNLEVIFVTFDLDFMEGCNYSKREIEASLNVRHHEYHGQFQKEK